MLYRILFWSSLLLLLTLASCYPPAEPVYEGVVVDLNEETARRVYDHQNNRQTDSLLHYLGSNNASLRYLAARAFASYPVAPEGVVDSLIRRLNDYNADVRTVAAYAVGQLGEERHADSLAFAFDTTGTLREYNAAVIASVGKTGSARHLKQLTDVTTYETNNTTGRPIDTLLSAAQAWGIFYFARRGISSEPGGEKMLNFLLDKSAPTEVRQPAAFYLQRFPVKLDEEREEALRNLLRESEQTDYQIAATRTLGRSKLDLARVALIRASRDARDWKVRTAAIRGLSAYDYSSVREPMVERLRDEHPLVRRTAANFLLENGSAADATFYRQLARDTSGNDVRYVLYAAANRHLPLALTDYRGRINYDLQRAYAATSDPYVKTEILAALAEFPWNYRTIYELYQQSNQAPVRSAAADALYQISKREDFLAFFRGSSRRVRLDLASYFREMILGLEVGPAYAAAEGLKDNAEDYRVFLPEPDWLNTALRGFKLPRDIEAYRAVDAARAALLGEEEPEPHTVDTEAKPIDWKVIGSDGGSNVVLRTSAGKITLRLWPDVAPATVSSFLKLANDKYYDGKVFHRVVPNFVAQGGGPKGDGFGAEDFMIRTEVPGPRWDRPGLIGMASAGKDTEGVQFFLTHRPAPHLDGNYTIFGEVIDGQDVVDRLVVGSRIESAEIQ